MSDTAKVRKDGSVVLGENVIGYVWKGTRLYSPPLYRGSRIVKYHKRVPEWHGSVHVPGGRPDFYADTRREVVDQLVQHAEETKP